MSYSTFLDDYHDQRYKERKEREKRKNELESGNLPAFDYGYKPPYFITNSEAYSLIFFFITGIPIQTHYLDKRNKWVHFAIEALHNYIGNEISVNELIQYLCDERTINKAGGVEYVQTIFKGINENDISY